MPRNVTELELELTLPEEALEQMGSGEIAYIRKLSGADLRNMFPDADLPSVDLPVWALLSADGSPIVFAETRNEALASAIESKLETLSLH